MRAISSVTLRPSNISPEQQLQIIALHQKYFDLDGSDIIKLLNKRDKVRLYYDKHTHTLIGTVGIQYIKLENHIVILYLGNVVVEDSYQRCGILSDAIFKEILYIDLKYPTYKKFQFSLTTTLKSFSYYQKIPDHWPRTDKETPTNIEKLMEIVGDKIFHNDYYIYHHHLLVKKNLVKSKSQFIDNATNSAVNNEFHLLNPNYENGDQLLCGGSISFENVLKVVLILLHKKSHIIMNRLMTILHFHHSL